MSRSEVDDVLAGTKSYAVVTGDCLQAVRQFPDDAFDVCVTSPPYENARVYGELDFKLAGQAWVDWVVAVVTATAPKVRGPVFIVVDGRTRDFSYSGTPFLLAADLLRAGFTMRKPLAFRRVGIPGSGGPDWLRGDWEPVLAVTRPGRLPYADPTACGHPPKWRPGGAMTHQTRSGRKVAKLHTKRDASGVAKEQGYNVPALANPGSTPQATYTAAEVRQILLDHGCAAGDVVECVVGGGRMGHRLAHNNEAPFGVDLCEYLVRPFCPPGGIVFDPFAGSCTAGHAALLHGRRFVGVEARQDQVDNGLTRLAEVSASLRTAEASR